MGLPVTLVYVTGLLVTLVILCDFVGYGARPAAEQ